MALFLGTYQNKLDAKGRVSIPASFRTVLKRMSHAGESALVATLVLRPSHQYPCIEGWTEKGFEALSAPLDQYNQFSQEHEDLVMALFGDATSIETDREGRIVLPADMVAYANLTDTVTFIGTNKTFQIWEPEAGARRIAEAKAAVRAAQLSLRTVPA
ncbi:division/cell wall cluster transcriptional repressor MraZ [Rhodopila sp.]|jgi:MraZ protein|uniref:division/cell wall cluster transcriptional repressor MraZ n=1 Tax=Rhodopila sp. TaxID=2480087 RepID=UPI002B6652BA|nr:division/cell wall cluster transcriptional repressor MraZ [Rhodopila sp.]HVZ08316.1 division/cell wall cluster transcriptional repressor MraZ [Rhodopila sp.]